MKGISQLHIPFTPSNKEKVQEQEQQEQGQQAQQQQQRIIRTRRPLDGMTSTGATRTIDTNDYDNICKSDLALIFPSPLKLRRQIASCWYTEFDGGPITNKGEEAKDNNYVELSSSSSRETIRFVEWHEKRAYWRTDTIDPVEKEELLYHPPSGSFLYDQHCFATPSSKRYSLIEENPETELFVR